MKIKQDFLHAMVVILFVISSVLASIYGIIFFKYLILFIGDTIYTRSIVVSTLFAGFILGLLWFGRKADSSKNRLRLYAVMELITGVYCLLFPQLLSLMESVFVGLVLSLQFSLGGSAVLILKIMFSVLSLLLPAVLIGGKLPVILRSLSVKTLDASNNFSMLYFIQNFSSAMGAIMTGFFFVRLAGLSPTIHTASILNILTGIIAYGLSTLKIHNSNITIQGRSTEIKIPSSAKNEILIIFTIGLSGFVAMIYMVAWLRMLLPVFGSSIYTFSLSLVTYLIGIAIGSYIANLSLLKIKRPMLFFTLCQFGVAIFLLVTLPFYVRLPYDFWNVSSLLSYGTSFYKINLLIQFVFYILLTIGVTLVLGMLLPVAVKSLARKVEVFGKLAGDLYAVLLTGTLLGFIFVNLILLPQVGIKNTLVIGILLNVIIGWLILLLCLKVNKRKAIVALGSSLVMLLIYFLLIPDWNIKAMLYGVINKIYTRERAPSNYSSFLQIANYSNEVLFYDEGLSANVGVIESDGQKAIVVDGKVDASTRDIAVPVLCAHLPCLLHGNPKQVLVIGLGNGVTLGSVLTHPVEKVDCIEKITEAVKACKFFHDVNNNPLDDARTNLFLEDPNTYLKLVNKKYDVIISGTADLWVAGTGNLLTTEFLQECKKKLNGNGYILQWLRVNEVDNDLFKMIVRTFQSVFNYVTVWEVNRSNVLLVGSESGPDINFQALDSLMRRRSIYDDLKRINIIDVPTLLSLQILSSDNLVKLVGLGEINTENLPRIEYEAPKAICGNNYLNEVLEHDERIYSKYSKILLAKYMSERKLKNEELQNMAFYQTRIPSGNTIFAYAILSNLNQDNYYRNVEVLSELAKIAERINLQEEALSYREKIIKLQPNNVNELEKYVWSKYRIIRNRHSIFKQIDISEFERMLLKCISLSSDTVDRFNMELAEIYYDVQEYEKAKTHYLKVLDLRQKYTNDPTILDDLVFLKIGKCFINLGQSERAIIYLLQAVRINPKNETARDLIYDILMSKSKLKKQM